MTASSPQVTFLTPSVSRELGGIYEAERQLALALDASTAVEIDVVGLHDASTEEDCPTWSPLTPTALPVRGPRAFGYAPAMLSVLREQDPDLVHLHSLWMYTSVAALKWARGTGRPHMISIHGMLDTWAIQNSRWKKRIAGALYEHANLQEAACLHVLNKSERQAVRNFGLTGPLCTLPNGVTLPPSVTIDAAPWGEQIPADANVVLFLGRIHPKKGLDVLVDAWHQLAHDAPSLMDTWHLSVVGWDDGGHTDRLRTRIKDYELDEHIHLLGPMFGDDKHAAFCAADRFILPSFSEGLPMAILEAWSYRLPVLLTPQCNLPEGPEVGAAVESEPTVDALESALESFLDMSDADATAMGDAGRTLVESTYTWTQIARDFADVYRWLVDDAPVPSSVSLP